MCEWLGHGCEEILGRTFPDFLPIGQKLFYANHQALSEEIGGAAQELSYDLRCADGGLLPILLTSETLDDGRQVYVLYRAENRRRYERQLLEAKKQADHAVKSRTDFVNTVSHEVRTPIHAIMSMVDLLRLEGVSEDQAEVIANLRKASEYLLGLVNDILDLSKAESRKLVLRPTPTHLEDLCDGILETLRSNAKTKGLRLLGRYDSGLDGRFALDAGKVRQILTNLIGNAIKFTVEGSVTLRVSYEGTLTEGQPTDLSFEVVDTGVGIAPEDLDRIFRPFEQTGRDVAGDVKGTGLGLAISRHLVAAFGGELKVHTSTDEGSTFYFAIPALYLGPTQVESGEDVRVPVSTENILRGMRVLHADDNATNRYIARRHLSTWGADFKEASGGQEAVDIARQYDFDVILLDLRMPELNGAEAAAAIRQLPNHRETKIFAISAGSLPDSMQTPEHRVFAGLLHKPYAAGQLLALLQGIEDTHQVVRPLPMAPVEMREDDYAIDLAELMSDFTEEEDEEEFRGLIQLMLSDLMRSRVNIVQAIAGGETDFVEDEHHRLKTTLRMLNPEPLTALITEATMARNQSRPNLAIRTDKALLGTISLLEQLLKRDKPLG